MSCRAAAACLLLVLSVASSSRPAAHSGAGHADPSRVKRGGKGHHYGGMQPQSQPDAGDTFPSFPPQSQRLFNAISAQTPVSGQDGFSTAVPTVRCGSKAMIITFQQRDMDSFLIERLDLTSSSLPLSHLPSGCGLSVRTTWTEVVLIAHYNGCFILLEEEDYILPVVWHGSRVKAYCPVQVPSPRVVCKASSMDLMVFGDETVNRLSVLLNGEWVSFRYAAGRCWFPSYASSESVVFSIPFTTCGLIQKGGMYRIYIQSRERAMEFSCPLQIPHPPRYQSNKKYEGEMLPSYPQTQTISGPNPPLDPFPPEADIQLSLTFGAHQKERQKLPDVQQQHTEVVTQQPSSQPAEVRLPFIHYTPELPTLPLMNPIPFELTLNIPVLSNRLPQPSLEDIGSVERYGSELLRLIPALVASGLSGSQRPHQEPPVAKLQQHTNRETPPEPHMPDTGPVPPPPYDSHLASVPPSHIQQGHVVP